MNTLDVSDLYTLPLYLDIRTNKPKWLVILYSNDCMWPLCLIIDVTNVNDDHKIRPLIIILQPSSPLVGNFYHDERTPPPLSSLDRKEEENWNRCHSPNIIYFIILQGLEGFKGLSMIPSSRSVREYGWVCMIPVSQSDPIYIA